MPIGACAVQLYENVRNTYAHFFETLPKQPSIPPLQYFPSLRSFKVLAETPLQGMCNPTANRIDHKKQQLAQHAAGM